MAAVALGSYVVTKNASSTLRSAGMIWARAMGCGIVHRVAVEWRILEVGRGR